MARQEQLLPYAREVIDVTVAEEMSESFLAYSLSVITARAIPDIRDGLKPVQRRILYSMLNMGIRPDTPHRKSARVVGDTMGNYHPHGDSAIYETLVRMGQSFARNVTLIDPQGNFGSLDDPPAAPRYTECRLTEAAMEMLDELSEDTVDFRPTYDGEGIEPECLPGRLPNLLVNGTTGIAVGMATNMASHNLREVYEAIILVMNKRRPKPTVDELMDVVPGPDFPSGGIIVDDDIRKAYETGRGSFRIRARAEVEPLTARRQAIVITELPHMIGPEKVVGKVKELVLGEKVSGISDIKNLSDRKSGLRIQIECKAGVNAQAILQQLYRLTPLEETFAINNVVLVNGVPTTLSLYDLCRHYIEHRLDVVVRRTNYRLERALERLHIVDGLLIALDNIDEVVRIIRGSETVSEAREELCSQLDLSEVQATHILDMQLRRLTALERQKIVDEHDQLLADVDDYRKVLGSETRRRTLVISELGELVEGFGGARRSEIILPEDLPIFVPVEIEEDTDIGDEPCVVTLSTSGQVGRASADGAKRATPGRHDLLVASVLTTTTATVWAITSEARVVAVKAFEIGEITGRSRGTAAAQLFGTSRGESILTISAGSGENITLFSANGTAKQVTAEEVAGTASGKTILNLKPGDRVTAAFPCPPGTDVIAVSSDAQALRMTVDSVSIQGRGAGGVAGMKLKGDATIVGGGPALGHGCIVSVATDGSAKATPFEEIPTKGRGTGGVRLTRLKEGSTLGLVYVGSLDLLLATVSTDDDRSKADPTPVPVSLERTKRDLQSTPTERPILALGPARW
jgi:DNA gyrase subunit A